MDLPETRKRQGHQPPGLRGAAAALYAADVIRPNAPQAARSMDAADPNGYHARPESARRPL